MPRKFHTTHEIARRTGLSYIAIIKSIERGRLRADKFGRDYMITDEDFQEFLDSRRVPSTGNHRRAVYAKD